MDDFYSQVFAVEITTAVSVLLENSFVHLWKVGEITPAMDLTIAELDAAECNFSGYAATKVVAWTGPYNYPGGGAYHESGLVIFDGEDATPFVGNTVGGYWVEDAGGALVSVGKLDSPVPIAASGDVVQLVIQLPQGVPVPPPFA